MTASRSFARRVEALEDIFAFTQEALPEGAVSPALRRSVDFVLEELFTNIIKYGGGQGDVRVDIALGAAGVEVTVTEPDAHFFDVTQAPSVDTTAPIETRQPGGLGLHLVRRLVDTLRYDYAAGERRGTIAFGIRMRREAPERKERDVDAGH
jgi:anti-sigma regulatory factor (Ser/Thr protein kinase)